MKVAESSAFAPDRPSSVVRVATLFGLVCGCVEATGFLVCQKFGWINLGLLNWVTTDILWIAPTSNILLFNLIGMLLIAVHRWTLIPLSRLLCAVLSFLTFYDWLFIASAGRIHRYALLILAGGIACAFARTRVQTPHLFLSRRCFWAACLTPVLIFGATHAVERIQEGLATRALTKQFRGNGNVLVLILDALRADHLSSHGYGRKTSPNLDEFAAQGVLFVNAISTSSWSLPSHTSLMTGRYSSEHGAIKMGDVYSGSYTTLAEQFHALGYRTGAFSANPGYFSRGVGLGRGFIHFEDSSDAAGGLWTQTVFGREVLVVLRHYGLVRFPSVQGLLGKKRAGDVTRAIWKWVAQDRTRPFFVVANISDVHAPYDSPEPFRSKFHASSEFAAGTSGRSPDRQTQQDIDLYDGALTYVDDEIARLLAEMAAQVGATNTLVAITADHGESFGEHGLFTHGSSLYLDQIHVPLMMSWPSHLPAGVRIEQPVSNAAIGMTILELLGFDNGVSFGGSPLNPLWAGLSRTNWPYPIAELTNAPFEPDKGRTVYHGSLRSVLTNDWHFIEDEMLGNALYKWRIDPAELHNIAPTLEGQRVVSQLRPYLNRSGVN